MADLQAQYILKNRRTKQADRPFFACMQCYPDDSPEDSRSLSSTYSRRHLYKQSIQPQTNNHHVYLKASQIAESRKSMNQKPQKISIKNRRTSNFQRQSIILNEGENIPSFLTNTHQPSGYRQPQTARSSISSIRCSNPHATLPNSINSGIRSSIDSRKTVPAVAFTYQKLIGKNQQPPMISNTNGFVSPEKSNPSTLSCNQAGYSPKQMAPHLSQLHPKVVISKQIEQKSMPIRDSQYLNFVPQQSSQLVKLQFSNKGISDLFKEKDREVYDSLEQIPILSKHSSSNSSDPQIKRKKSSLGNNFGNGRGKLHVRQTVSIKQPEEEDLHESIVIEKSNRGNLTGLLNPISESDEFGSAMGGTFLCHGRGPSEQMMDQF